MGVADDGGLLRLAEDLGQTHHRHDAAADQVVKEPTRPHAGQLIRVAYQHQAALVLHGPQQRRHQGDVHHGHLVHDDGLSIQRFLLVLGEGQLSLFRVVACAQQTMDGGGFGAAQLAEPFGRAAGGGCQGGFQTHGLEQAQNASQGRGLTGARPTGEQHDLHPSGQLHRLPLLFRVAHPLLLLHPSHQLGDALRRMQLPLAHLGDAPGDVLFCLI